MFRVLTLLVATLASSPAAANLRACCSPPFTQNDIRWPYRLTGLPP